MGCILSDDQIVDRKVDGLMYACVVVFLSLFILNYFDFIKKVQENNYIEWDVKTITSGDYTVEINLDPEFFQAFVD